MSPFLIDHIHVRDEYSTFLFPDDDQARIQPKWLGDPLIQVGWAKVGVGRGGQSLTGGGTGAQYRWSGGREWRPGQDASVRKISCWPVGSSRPSGGAWHRLGVGWHYIICKPLQWLITTKINFLPIGGMALVPLPPGFASDRRGFYWRRNVV